MIGVHLRNALIMSIILPISILVTFIVMFLLKIEFHFISISALIISLGILVDNGIVICEAISKPFE
jgi:multidrug efflux pump